MRTRRSWFFTAALVAACAPHVTAQSGSFGHDVVIGTDELIIAEPNNYFRPGLVYIYRRGADSWSETARLSASNAERADGFGAALAVTGNTLFIAQRGGRVHRFERQGATWRFVEMLDAAGITGLDPGCNAYGYCGTDFGITLAASGDWLLVGNAGAPIATTGRGGGRGAADEPAPPPGSVHAFQRAADGRWIQREPLSPSRSAPGDGFGAAILLTGDRALIGAPNATWNPGDQPQAAMAGGRGGRGGAPQPAGPVEKAGRVDEFRLENGAWREVGPLSVSPEANALFGAALALEGDAAIVGAPGSSDGHGAAFVYRRDPGSGVWSEPSRLTAFSGMRGDRFGGAVAITGGDVWVGAPVTRGIETGMAYVFSGEPGNLLMDDVRRFRFTEERTGTQDGFGDRVFARGNLAAVTASGMHHQAGGLFVYERDASGAWRETGSLVSPPDALAPMAGEERRCTDGTVGPFDCSEVELLAFVPNSILRAPENARGVRTNDNWGWTDPETGREYALVGRNDGTAFVDITDPVHPVLVGDLPKTPGTPRSQLWRDIKTYRNHAFIVADGAGEHGMQVFDLTRLRSVRNPPALFEPDVLYRGTATHVVASSHNIGINEETGYAYLIGGGCGGLHMVDIREPKNPAFAGCADPGSTHDIQCLNYRGPDQRYRDREICLRSAGSLFIISDVTDKTNPRMLARTSHPDPAYMHQGWVTHDHQYFIMDDESDVIRGTVPTTRTLIWDLSDLEDPQLAKQFMGSMPASAHNLYIRDGFAYQANYRYGLHIVDVSDPLNPREVGSFDTSPYQVGPGFSGAWSTYPFFRNGAVIVTSLQEGLFILKKRERPIS
ncbi:MAG: choice-of-anchor B family protein [Gemmatimonadetes bacterium]|nr:choice-of-anchor B family protein [Gemmatimonadota bacterium]